MLAKLFHLNGFIIVTIVLEMSTLGKDLRSVICGSLCSLFLSNLPVNIDLSHRCQKISNHST